MSGGWSGGWIGCGWDRFRSAEGNIRVGDGSGLLRGTERGGKVAENDEGSENLRGRS